MSGITMGVPSKFKVTSCNPYLAVGGKILKYAKKYFNPCKNNIPNLFEYFYKHISNGGGGGYGHPVYLN